MSDSGVLVKVCSTCMTEKPIDVFGRDKKTSDGRYYQCRLCRNTHANLPEVKARRNQRLAILRAKPEWRERLRLYRMRDDVKDKRKLYESSPARVQKRMTALSKIIDVTSLTHNQFLTHIFNWAMIVKHGKNCVCCKKPADDAHHIFYKKKYPQLTFSVNNGVPLCVQHHHEVHRWNP